MTPQQAEELQHDESRLDDCIQCGELKDHFPEEMEQLQALWMELDIHGKLESIKNQSNDT